ncbi:MAG: hypothetical protein KA314_29480 [Chloroflexi bacterium]|nr:hypothetical protein [Chloroflexota bacterium]MBP8059991.1 hypothetical protein [Chloroflexota bacterium]
MKRTSFTFPLLLLMGLILALVPPAAAQGDDGTEAAEGSNGIHMEVEAGMDNYYKTGFWIPVHVTVANDGPPLEGLIVIQLSDSGNEQIFTAPVSLPTQSNKRVTLYVTLDNFTSRLTVELQDENGDLITTARTKALVGMEMTDLLYGVISANGGEFGFLEDVLGGRTSAKVALLDLNDLPIAAAGWDMLDVLVVHDTDMSQLTTEQQEALNVWIGLGGKLVVTGGTGWQKTTTGLADYLPVTVTGSESIADLPALRNRVGLPFPETGPYLITMSTLRNGELLLHENGLPLLAEREWGRGRVYFLALDPTLSPLADWDGNALLWGQVVNSVPRTPFWGQKFSNFFAASEAIKNIPSLTLPSAILLFCFMGFYVLLIGPANYLILRRLKRREWAWVTIPGIIIFFTACAYLTGFGLKGNDLILHQMNVAYGQTNSPALRVNSLVALYSPTRATYDFILPSEAMALPFSQGANYGPVTAGDVETIERGTQLIMRDVRVDVSDSQTFVVESYAPAPPISSEVRLILQNSRYELNVSLRNESELTLTHAILLYGSTVQPLGSIAPGEEKTWSQSVSASVATGSSSSTYSYGGYTSPLLTNDTYLLGTASYYDDPVAYSRRQLLEALHADLYYSTSSSSLYAPAGVVTLIAWAETPLLELNVDSRRGQEQVATTLYFLELPMTETQISGRDLTVPESMLTWEVRENSGQYSGIGIRDFTLYNGSIEYEFLPNPEFDAMTVNSLQLTINRQTYSSSPLPEVSIWNWQTENWLAVTLDGWGTFNIPDPSGFLGPGNRVRFLLENNTPASIDIQSFYPIFKGNVE